ncbi:MAG: diguanylate cyclase [Eubacteriales bacterium]|nr:GGDEF domain-containing protein [Bacillota bacterium]MBV1727701.1 GGDEF domain-containing protein [Desulforudis sp.]MDP3049817.1 diguanylate cyclase [Eubacteriales bacterium]MBU4532763.1 GGDEF domain-containing protein [Bacillota bacterium]MBU4554576.1 GGDEF domain-containing protein [Bacillota bacterium]
MFVQAVISQVISDEDRPKVLHDPLTGLPNRTLFEQLSSNALLRAKRQGHRLAVMFIDLDDFKETNDLFGHEFGDRAHPRSLLNNQ